MLSLKRVEENNAKIARYLYEQIKGSKISEFPITDGSENGCSKGRTYLRFFNDWQSHDEPIYVHCDPVSIAYYLIHGNQDDWDWLNNDQSIMREFILTAENPWSVVHFDDDWHECLIAHETPEYMQEYKDHRPEMIQLSKSYWYRKEHDYVGQK